MIVFSSLQIRRGVRVLLDNATATINPGQKVGLVGKNGCGKSTLLSLLKNEISADGGSMTFPGNWQLAWVNQETALPQPASIMLLTAIVNTASWKPRSSRLTSATTATPSPPSTASWTPSTPGPSAPAPPACCTAWVSAMNSLNAGQRLFRRLAYAP
jgi:ATPase subunit of ABC transporter with duplicated ATPase domains